MSKGAPRRLLEMSASIAIESGAQPLDDAQRAERAGGERRDGAATDFACSRSRPGPLRTRPSLRFERLTFVGLVGFADPPAEGVKEAIVRLRAAGLRTVMLTGDQRATAAAVGRELNLLSEGQAIIDGRELDALSDERADARGCRRSPRSAASRRSTSCDSCRRFRREATSSPCSATA